MARIRVVVAALLAALAAAASAEIPLMKREELRGRASHIVTGKATAIDTQQEKGKDRHDTKGVVEIAVTKVEKGGVVEPSDAVYGRFWTRR